MKNCFGSFSRYQFDEWRARATNRSWMWTWVSGFFNKILCSRGRIEKCELQLLDRPLVTCSIVCISIATLPPKGDIEFIRLKTIREHERTRSHLHIRRRSQVRLIGVDITQELVLKRFSNRFLPEKMNRFKMSSAIRKLMFVFPKSRTEITPSGLSSCADGFGIYCLTDLITWITAIITPN